MRNIASLFREKRNNIFGWFYLQNGAEDLRIKLEVDYSPQPPTSNTTPSTPTSLVSYMDINKETGLPTNMASVAPAEMLNVWNATKMNSKTGTVNTADGKCQLCKYAPQLCSEFRTDRYFHFIFEALLTVEAFLRHFEVLLSHNIFLFSHNSVQSIERRSTIFLPS